ncbi:hypothetical protein [Bradyrhizobium mercantei]|uniref:hypothetical protein n=1 Tax=Bradyrhizobium mercantei TaxID=1904807 RepID=UPI000977142D|nr:hypothetical protein [Bradyrhizobium mercantei]
MTIVPGSGPDATAGAPLNPADRDKARRIQDLLEQVEVSRGAQAGTVKATSTKGATINLQHDLTKIRNNFQAVTDAPFGSALSEITIGPEKTVANTPANVEYRSTDRANGVERIVSIKSKNSVAANAFRSGQQPVTLKVENAGLIASQIPSNEPLLPVKVQVGDQTRELKVGDVSRFGSFDVTVLASSNRSAKQTYEGQPYVLRLQVMPVQ